MIKSKTFISCISDSQGTCFFLPNKCPVKDASPCPNLLLDDALSAADKSVNPPAQPAGKSVNKRSKNKAVLVETEVRRSPRIKTCNKGFKKSGCSDKFYVGCSSKPPSLTAKAIRELSSTMCDIDAALVTDAALGKKTKTGVPGSSKKASKKTSNKKKKVATPMETEHLEEDDESVHEDED